MYHVEFSTATDFLENRMSTSDIVLIDDTVMSLYPTMIPDPFPHERVLRLRPTENLKTYLQIGSIIDQILDLGITRSHQIVAIGGGIIQDISSFASSIIHRGIPWIFVPTTLLTQ